MATPTPPFGAGAQSPLQNPALLRNPYAVYAMLRAANPVFRVPLPVADGAGVWVLTRYAEVEQVLKDRRFSADRLRADAVQANRERLPVGLLGGPRGLRTMLMMDPPDHTRLRGLVSKAFTPRRIGALADRIRELVDELMDAAVAERRFDLMPALAEPLPALVIAELLGVPAADHRQFKEWASDLIDSVGTTPFGGAADAGALERKVDVLLDYLSGIIAERRKEPGDDLISAMIGAQEERDALTDQELLSTSFLLLLAGHETTTNLIGNGTLALMRQREQWERLCAEPGRIPAAVEELLRFDGPVQFTVRVAAERVELGGQPLEPGALVVCGIAAANRDPARFADPDHLDVEREEVHHLGFGIGTHFCLGAALARLEAQLAFQGLVSRCPALRLEVADDAVEYRPNFALRGLRALPVSC